MEQISIDTLHLDLIRRESSDIVVDLVQKSQNKKNNTLVIHSHLDLQQRHDISKEGVPVNVISKDPCDCKDPVHTSEVGSRRETGDLGEYKDQISQKIGRHT